MRTRLVGTAAVLAAAPLLLAGCGTDTGGPASASEATPAETAPVDPPTGPPWPDYPADDYRYQLVVSCFCVNAGVPFTVTVRDGEVTAVEYARSGPGHAAGDPVPEDWLRLTINDIIDDANDPGHAEASVRWRAGRSHPSWVWIDRIKNAIDDEVGYRVRHVQTLRR